MTDEKVSIIPEGNSLQRLWDSIDFAKWLRRLKVLGYILAGLLYSAAILKLVGLYVGGPGRALGVLAIILPPLAVALGLTVALGIGIYHTVKKIVGWAQLKLAMRAALK